MLANQKDTISSLFWVTAQATQLLGLKHGRVFFVLHFVFRTQVLMHIVAYTHRVVRPGNRIPTCTKVPKMPLT